MVSGRDMKVTEECLMYQLQSHPGGMAGSPGVRQFPPLTVEWEKKYKENLLLVEKEQAT